MRDLADAESNAYNSCDEEEDIVLRPHKSLHCKPISEVNDVFIREFPVITEFVSSAARFVLRRARQGRALQIYHRRHRNVGPQLT